MEHPQFIKNHSLERAQEIFAAWGEKPYRARQLFNWLYERNVTSFDEMTDFSKVLRTRLNGAYRVGALTVEQHLVSRLDATEKYLFRTHDGHFVESVLIKRDGDDSRLTICVSSQVGCAMGCGFCSTAKLGIVRNLEPAEILDQVCHVRRVSGLKNDNIVLMGMGEPFNNYENVMAAADIMNYSFGFHLSVRRITISTCGILPMIERYIDEKRPYNLAISVNDTDPALRKKHMPVENKYPLAQIAALLNRKLPVSHNRTTLEYVMRRDNIGRENAQARQKLFRFTHINMNLIPLNPGAHEMDSRPRR
jgi:23S rRNA (adenine2503-C2)-methyltransferase